MRLLAILPLLPLTLSQVTGPLPSPTETAPVPTYSMCSLRPADGPIECDEGYTCIDDPHDVNGCGMACDDPGICVPDEGLEFCGGIAAIQCPDGLLCVDDPNDGCNPNNGGADCGGICV